MLKLQETPYIVKHRGSERTIYIEIYNTLYKVFESEKLSWYKNDAYKHYDVGFIAVHSIIKNLLKPYFRKYKTKNSVMYYSIILYKDNKFICVIKPFHNDTELKNGLKEISNKYHVSYYSIEYKKLGDIKLNNEIEEFISKQVYMYECGINYETISLKLLGEDGKYYG
jgi:hypothetical protein